MIYTNTTTQILQNTTICSSFILPFILPIFIYTLYGFIGWISSNKKFDKYFPDSTSSSGVKINRTFIIVLTLLYFAMIINCIIRYQGEIYKSLFVNYELLEKSLEFKGWYGDYKGVLLLSLIICIKFLKKNLKCDNIVINLVLLS